MATLKDILKSKKKEILLAGISAILGLILSVVFAEIYFWQRGRYEWVAPVTQFDPELGWANAPNSSVIYKEKTYSTNSLGFRSGEIDPSREHILVVGDSVAFGAGVGDTETVSYFLGEEFKKYQVLNLAVSGYSIDQYYLALKKHIDATHPKFIIVVVFTGNDWFETMSNHMHGVDKPFFIMNNGRLALTNPRISRFSCRNLLAKTWISRKFGLSRMLEDKFCANGGLDEPQGEETIIALLNEIEKMAVERGAHALFAISPTMVDYFIAACPPAERLTEFCKKNRPYFKSFLVEKNRLLGQESSENRAQSVIDNVRGYIYLLFSFQRVFKNAGFDYIDLFSEYKRKAVDIERIYNNEPYHYSPAGNKLLAETIYEHLSEKYPDAK